MPSLPYLASIFCKEPDSYVLGRGSGHASWHLKMNHDFCIDKNDIFVIELVWHLFD